MKRDTLGVYNSKRDFKVTPEPAGEAHKTKKRLSYFIQRHDATRLHFDFRLELDGVLKSWAVPKGPSLSPKEKRLAVEVEDHPFDYGTFEGAIPMGEYGGGHVLLWDKGEWIPHGDPHEGLRKGRLSFTLAGDRLEGGFALVRMRSRGETKTNWLLIKEKDEFSCEGPKAEITRSAKVPSFEKLGLELATLVPEIPRQEGWIYEIKLDGYRALVSLENGKATVRSRNGKDWTERFSRIRKAIEALPITNAVFDGEVCAVDAEGRTRFQDLQNALSEGAEDALQYFMFDLLFVDGFDIRDRPLLVRKAILESVLHGAKPPLVFLTHLDSKENITTLFKEVCRRGMEGLIAKKRERSYVRGRGGDWVKIKCLRRQELAIVGFTKPGGARSGFGALLLGVKEDDGFRYVGKVGTGFSEKSLADLSKKLKKLVVPESAARGAPRMRDATWVKPALVCEVSFTEWTRDGSLRHPSFLGLREDKEASEVVRERATSVPSKSPPNSAAKSPAKSPLKSPSKKNGNVVGGVTISHPERVVDETSGLTKLELAQYHEAVAPLLLPYADHRPLALVRCPEGTKADCFFQKKLWAGAPPSVHSGTAAGQEVLYVTDQAGLLSLVQFGAIELHGWGSRFPAPAKPDLIVMDLDPDENLPFSRVIDAALEMREVLRSLGLESFVKTTGGKGLHIVAPFKPSFGWTEVKALTETVAHDFARRQPDRFTANMAKRSRVGKIFVDFHRNGEGATAVLPYSPRTKPGMTVAMPVPWRDLRHVDPSAFTVRTAPAILRKRKKDPWADYFTVRQELPASLRNARLRAS